MAVHTKLEHNFTPEQTALIQKHLSDNCSTDRCHMCGSNDWIPAGPVGAPLLHRAQDDVWNSGPEVVPLLMLICRTCQNVLTMLWRPILDPET